MTKLFQTRDDTYGDTKILLASLRVVEESKVVREFAREKLGDGAHRAWRRRILTDL